MCCFFYWRYLDNWSFPAINPELSYFSIRQESHLHVLKDNRIFCFLWLLNGAKVTLDLPAKIFRLHFQTICQNFPATEQGKKCVRYRRRDDCNLKSCTEFNFLSQLHKGIGMKVGVQRFKVKWKKICPYPGFAYKYVHINPCILYLKFRISNAIASSDKKKFCVCYSNSIFRSQNI